jgi:hypothetical protein
MNEMRKLMETVSQLSGSDNLDYEFDDEHEFVDYIEQKAGQNPNLEIVERWQSRAHDNLEIRNRNTGVYIIVHAGYEGAFMDIHRNENHAAERGFRRMSPKTADKIVKFISGAKAK